METQTDRQTETERERDRETEKETDRDRQTHRERYSDRQTDRDRDTERDRDLEADRARQTKRDCDKETERDRDIETKRDRDRNRQKQTETDRSAGRMGNAHAADVSPMHAVSACLDEQELSLEVRCRQSEQIQLRVQLPQLPHHRLWEGEREQQPLKDQPVHVLQVFLGVETHAQRPLALHAVVTLLGVVSHSGRRRAGRLDVVDVVQVDELQ